MLLLQAFLEYYYGLFGSNRAGLASLYQDQSMFTFEGIKCLGPQAIMAKLTSLPLNQCKITPSSMDFQPSISGGIIVFVTGHVLVGASSQQLHLYCSGKVQGHTVVLSFSCLIAACTLNCSRFESAVVMGTSECTHMLTCHMLASTTCMRAQTEHKCTRAEPAPACSFICSPRERSIPSSSARSSTSCLLEPALWSPTVSQTWAKADV